jgi:hypothetical protein
MMTEYRREAHKAQVPLTPASATQSKQRSSQKKFSKVIYKTWLLAPGICALTSERLFDA